MDADTLSTIDQSITDLYAAMRDRWPGFVERPGQLLMIQAVKETLLAAKERGAERDGSNIACLQGPTGVGKSAAYAIASAAVSLHTKRPVLISTATVSLQEQLYERDLPNLAKISPFPINFAIIKGRGRYVCRVRLAYVIGEASQGQLLDDPVWERPPQQQEVRWLAGLHQDLDAGRWDGDRDSRKEPIDPDLWARVQAEQHSCPGRHCPQYETCSFYMARKEAKGANIIVGNHDLVLSTIANDGKSLPEPEETIFVFDEGHHLPDIGLEQFTTSYPLSASLRMLERAGQAVRRFSAMVPGDGFDDSSDFAAHAIARSRDLLNALSAASDRFSRKDTWRFPHGTPPGELLAVGGEIGVNAKALGEQITILRESLQAERDNVAEERREPFQVAMLELAGHAGRIGPIAELWSMWSQSGPVPDAKWIERKKDNAGRQDFILHASPVTAAGHLSRHLWRRVAAAVITSATLTACGEFDYFAKLSGLRRLPRVRFQSFESPFDYMNQGELRIPAMRSDPKAPDAHTRELAALLPGEVARFAHGQLILFASRRQMEVIYAALPADLQADVLVQGTRQRHELLTEHRERVRAGRRSILFGLQSFGEGLDLPGELCEHVAIAKIPFPPPDSPCEEALAEWLETQDRNAFAEITVPKAGLKMTQWAGRGIRTIHDHATITVFDTRLTRKSYGKRILKGLPPYTLRDETGTRNRA